MNSLKAKLIHLKINDVIAELGIPRDRECEKIMTHLQEAAMWTDYKRQMLEVVESTQILTMKEIDNARY